MFDFQLDFSGREMGVIGMRVHDRLNRFPDRVVLGKRANIVCTLFSVLDSFEKCKLSAVADLGVIDSSLVQPYAFKLNRVTELEGNVMTPSNTNVMI